jgi:hypothetical protein
MPGIVDAEATIPSKSLGVPRLVAKGFKTGFFDIVELKIANKPIMHITAKKARCVHLFPSMPKPKKASIGTISCLRFSRRIWFINAVFISSKS